MLKGTKQDVRRNIKLRKDYITIISIIFLLIITIFCFWIMGIALIGQKMKYEIFFGALGAWLFFIVLTIYLLVTEIKRLNGELEDIQRLIDNKNGETSSL